ncbi:MAG TPA: histidine kinase [Puia sp.]|nr:histidine kinase [Puia sp.]
MISIYPQWYTRKWVTVTLHVLFWILFFVSPYVYRIAVSQDSSFHQENDWGKLYTAIFLNNCAKLLLFYINANLLIPRLIYRRRIKQYFGWLVLYLCLQMVWDRLTYSMLLPGLHFKAWSYLVLDLPFFVFFVLVSTAYRVIADKITEQRQIKEKETENLKTELSFLRSQVSPHFMFNVLNNMVALARKKSDLLEPSLIKLSSLLRYMLYETDEDKVLLEKEVEYLKSYIELQSQRFGRHVLIQADFQPMTDGFFIEPMLLIPFVENAFKHGTGLVHEARIEVRLKIEDGRLDFCVRNRFNETMDWEKDKTSGIGLTNVKRRLNLLYLKRHTLEIDRENGWFSVSLKLNLH